MRLVSRPLDLVREDASAAALLGHDHPLVRAVDRFSLLVQRSLIVAALLSTSIVALVEGVSSAQSQRQLCSPASCVARVVAACTKQERALDLIIEGRGHFPLAVIDRERRRLLDANHREALARSLEGMRTESENPVRRRPLAPRCSAPAPSPRSPPI